MPEIFLKQAAVQCIQVFGICIFSIRMFFAIQVGIRKAGSNKITLLQAHGQALFAVLLIDIQFGIIENRVGDHLPDNRQQGR